MTNLITASIVLYCSDILDVTKTIGNIFSSNWDIVVYLIDNSPSDELEELKNINPNIRYIHTPSNPGFGAGHNIAIKRAIELGSKYHFVVNPDIYFNEDVIAPMLNYIENNSDVGMMMPKILNEDGTIQYLPKLLPNLFWILRRKLKRFDPNHQYFISKYELRYVDENKIYNAPILSGCFTLLNMAAIRDVGSYDDAYFMYFEDWDLSRRMHLKYKTIYFPMVYVYHGYDSGANKSRKLFNIFIKSAITYFTKWGWIFDKERKQINKNTLKQFEK